jgi:predicted RND superfamily exporter protein
MNCQNLHKLIYRYYAVILLVALAGAGIGGYFTSKLTLQSDLTALLPDSFESVKTLNRIRDEVGGVGSFRIVLESKNYQALVDLSTELERRLVKSSFVNNVDYKNDVAFYNKYALLFLEDAELDSLEQTIRDKVAAEKQKLNPLFVDDLFADPVDESDDGDDLKLWEDKYKHLEKKQYYTNADSTVLVIQVSPSGTNTSLAFVQDMYDEMTEIVDSCYPQNYADDMQVYYGGNFKNRLDEYAVIKDDILGTALYGFGGVFLLIIIYFRRLTGAVLITLTLLCSLTWTFGVVYWVIGNLNTITGFLFVILFGLGIDYGIHAFARYVESRKSGLSFETAIEKMVCQTGKALFTTAITTSAAFFSLMIMDFKGFSDLGFISGIGILFALLAMIVLLPALITFTERFNILRISTVDSAAYERRFARFPYPATVLMLALLFSGLCVYSAMQLQFEYDFTNLRAITEERELVGEKTEGVFSLSESPALILANSKEDVNELVTAVRERIRSDTTSPTIAAVRSVFSLVPENQQAKLEKIRIIRDLVEEEAVGVVKGEDEERLNKLRKYLAVNETFGWQDFPEKDKRVFVNKQGEIGNFVFIYPDVPLRDGRNSIAFRNDVTDITTESGKTYSASSSNVVMADMLIVMLREGEYAVALTFVVVFLLVLLDLRELKGTLLVLTPLALGMLWMLGIMVLSGMKLNLFNIVVLPSVIGIGVDNGVHIYHRYREEGAGSLRFVLRHTGLAIMMTTLTTIVGYSGLIIAHHPGLNSIGDLAVIGITATFVTAIIVLPAILQASENRGAGKTPAR